MGTPRGGPGSDRERPTFNGSRLVLQAFRNRGGRRRSVEVGYGVSLMIVRSLFSAIGFTALVTVIRPASVYLRFVMMRNCKLSNYLQSHTPLFIYETVGLGQRAASTLQCTWRAPDRDRFLLPGIPNLGCIQLEQFYCLLEGTLSI